MSFALETTLFLLGFDTFIIPEKAGFLKDFGLVDIDTGHEPVKLSPGQISDLRVFPRPLVSAMHCQLFIDQYKTICIAVQGLDPVPASATEQKQRTGCRIQLQLFFHDCTKSVNRFAHIGVTADNVDPFQP